MDPISQGALGAIASTSLAEPKQARLALLVGWAGGMLADADIFIRSESDPLLNIEFHRHFTHSLAFIPIGGLLCAGVFWLLLRSRRSFKELFVFAIAGYATAGLLDACTSYGTQLLWPFSNARIAWNIISIIDPIFTLGLLVALGIGFARRNRFFPRIGLAFALGYLLLGVVQNDRASSVGRELAGERGHSDATRFTVKPSIGNLLLWRSMYERDDQIYVDAVRVGFFGQTPTIFEGAVTEKVDLAGLRETLDEASPLWKDLDRFEHFSDGYLAWHPEKPMIIGDARYAVLPNSILPLWGIEFDASKQDRHAPFVSFRQARAESGGQLWSMLVGEGSRD